MQRRLQVVKFYALSSILSGSLGNASIAEFRKFLLTQIVLVRMEKETYREIMTERNDQTNAFKSRADATAQGCEEKDISLLSLGRTPCFSVSLLYI